MNDPEIVKTNECVVGKQAFYLFLPKKRKGEKQKAETMRTRSDIYTFSHI